MGRTADAIAEGMSIAAAAARLAVRNRILVETIANDEPFDVELFVPFACKTLERLAREHEKAAERTLKQRKKAWGRHSDPDGTHDYRDRDTGNLRKRHRQYVGVARHLRAQAQDTDAVRRLIEESRDAAWGDVESNLQRRLQAEALRPELDPDYATMREARMQSLRMIDIPRLAAHRRKLAEGAAAAAAEG
ncbi:asparagine synthase [Microbacterium ulmi]|uniref:Asparagine synthase n=1 Tax=Microbacterium ulmi TaxID=179095 RepID=A0A7Y2M244_9MICO|nr:asparagine synthase [Microbacterium ulmi]NII68888.1 hypothetical protein [Microbacterium ulmi]NNH05116.1 asparagine synthase [Microbacterium ulmi]